MGAYYTDHLERMRKEGRIGKIPYDPDIDVDTAWDLGVDDETVIGFFQSVRDVRTGAERVNLIDVHADTGLGVEDYWRFLKNEKPYTYGRHWGPHDLAVKEWGTGNTRLQTAWKIGLNFEVIPKLGVVEGIQAVRRMFPYLWADEVNAAEWIQNIGAYRREYDELRQTYLDKPVHDKASHWGDMTRYRALAFSRPSPLIRAQALQEFEQPDTDYSVFGGDAFEERDDPFTSWRRDRPNWSRLGR